VESVYSIRHEVSLSSRSL